MKAIWVIHWHYEAEGLSNGPTHIVACATKKEANERAKSLKEMKADWGYRTNVVSGPTPYVPQKGASAPDLLAALKRLVAVGCCAGEGVIEAEAAIKAAEGDPSDWPEDLRVRQMPQVICPSRRTKGTT
jgi:hypothetical protein